MSTLKFNRWQSTDGVTRNAVLQVVSKEVNTITSTTATSFTDATDMFLAITPTSATSKILIMMDIASRISRSSGANYIAHRLLRNSTEVFNPSGVDGSGNFFRIGYSFGGTTSISAYINNPLTFLDSPATTDEITYKLQFTIYSNTNLGTAYINPDNTKSYITLMEIAQ